MITNTTTTNTAATATNTAMTTTTVTATATALGAKSTTAPATGAELRKKLTFVPRETTPNPVEENKINAAAAPGTGRKRIDPANLFGQQDETKPSEKATGGGKIKIPVFDVDVSDEDAKKAEKPKPQRIVKPATDQKDEGDDFKNKLAAMFKAGPRVPM